MPSDPISDLRVHKYLVALASQPIPDVIEGLRVLNRALAAYYGLPLSKK